MPKEWWWSWSRYQKILLLKCPFWLHLYSRTTERQFPGLGNAAQLSAADADTLSIMHLFHAYSDPQHWLRAVWWEWTFSVGRLAQAAPCPHRTQAVPCCLRASQYSQGSWPQNSNRPAIPGQAGLLPSARVSTSSSPLSQLQNKKQNVSSVPWHKLHSFIVDKRMIAVHWQQITSMVFRRFWDYIFLNISLIDETALSLSIKQNFPLLLQR